MAGGLCARRMSPCRSREQGLGPAQGAFAAFAWDVIVTLVSVGARSVVEGGGQGLDA
ncbi:hypothetical protein EDD29_5759 [Actinocorallia herbida]|uniref:Uncharacterized protein n=1 Tax=Actinocorallia herbida TaxID=58109 RepID=A0A3N1D3K9_9ACTN|nr:hypothetical protein EDD29_5759 [Actinocorallia herbida]